MLKISLKREKTEIKILKILNLRGLRVQNLSEIMSNSCYSENP